MAGLRPVGGWTTPRSYRGRLSTCRQPSSVVRPICDDVAARGTAALEQYSHEFDHVVPDSFRVPAEALAAAEARLDPDLRAAFETAISRRRTVSAAELGESVVDVVFAPGASVQQRMIPVGRVGLYVPGGLAPLSSQRDHERGARPGRRRRLASPWHRRRSRSSAACRTPAILAVCHLLGIDEVYAVGGAQAIAMFAYGVPDLCAPVDLVTGPGNIYVVAAKRLLKGRVEHRLRGRPHRDRRAGRRHRRPGARRRRPDLPGRARPAGCRRPGHRLRRSWPRRSRPSSPTRCRQTKHGERDLDRADRSAVRGRAGRRHRAGRSRWSTATPPSTWRSRPRTRPLVAARITQRGRDLRRPVVAGVARRLLRRQHPRPAHRRLRLPLLGSEREELPQGGARHRLLRRPPWPRSPDDVEVFAEAEDLPAHGAAVARRFGR